MFDHLKMNGKIDKISYFLKEILKCSLLVKAAFQNFQKIVKMLISKLILNRSKFYPYSLLK